MRSTRGRAPLLLTRGEACSNLKLGAMTEGEAPFTKQDLHTVDMTEGEVRTLQQQQQFMTEGEAHFSTMTLMAQQ